MKRMAGGVCGLDSSRRSRRILVTRKGRFPLGTVRFIVPFPGGGINDVLARIVGEKTCRPSGASRSSSRTRTGAGGNIGAELAYQSEPDGYRAVAQARPGTARGQPEPLQAALLQAAGIRADHRGRLGSECRDRAQRAAGEFTQGADRLCQGEPRER